MPDREDRRPWAKKCLLRLLRYVERVCQDLFAHPLHLVISVVALTVGSLAMAITTVLGSLASEVFIAAAEQQTARATTFAADVVKGDGQLSWDQNSRDARDRIHAIGGNALLIGEIAGTSAQHVDQKFIAFPYWGDFVSVRRAPVVAGRWPSGRSLPPEVVVNTAFQQSVGEVFPLELGGNLPSVEVTIVGKIADGQQEPRLYLPGKLCDAAYVCATSNTRLLVHGFSDRGSVEAAVKGVPGLRYQEFSRFDTTDTIRQQIASLQQIFLACAAIALVVSLLGLMNLGLANISHRSRELSIRRALGVTSGENVTLVLGGAIALGLLAAALAIALLAILIYLVLPILLPPATGVTAPSFPWEAVGTAIAASVATSALASLAPAIVARRVEIASVLRA